MGKLVSELTSYLAAMAQDFANNTQFWLLAATTLMLAVVGALTFSASMPRLIPKITSMEQNFVSRDSDHRVLSHGEMEDALKKEMQEKLLHQLSLASPNSGSTKSEGPAVGRGSLGEETLLPNIALLQLNVGLNITNNAASASVVTRATISIIEEVDGQRHPLENESVATEVNVENKLATKADIKIPERQVVNLTLKSPPNFVDAVPLLMDYEAVRLLRNQIAGSIGPRSDGSKLLEAYVSLLAQGSKKHEEHLLILANAKRRCRIVAVIVVEDMFGRPFFAESEVANSFAQPQSVPSK